MKKTIVSGILGLCVSASVMANEQSADASGEGYFLAGLGIVEVDEFCDDSDIPGFTTTCDDKTVAAKVGLGVTVAKNFGFEFGLHKTGDVEASIYDSFDRIDGTFTARIISAQFVARAPVGSAYISFKGGMAHAKVDLDVSVSGDTFGSGSASESSSSTSPMFSLAFDVPIAKQAGLYFQYDLISDVGEEDTTGESDLSFLSAGLRFGF